METIEVKKKSRIQTREDVKKVYEIMLSRVSTIKYVKSSFVSVGMLPDGTCTVLSTMYHIGRPHTTRVLFELGYLETRSGKYLKNVDNEVRRSKKPLPEMDELAKEALKWVCNYNNKKVVINNDVQQTIMGFQENDNQDIVSKPNTEIILEAPNYLYKRYFLLQNSLSKIDEERLKFLQEINATKNAILEFDTVLYHEEEID